MARGVRPGDPSALDQHLQAYRPASSLPMSTTTLKELSPTVCTTNDTSSSTPPPPFKDWEPQEFVQDSWALICQLLSESSPRSSLDRTWKDAVRRQWARITRIIWTLLPTLTHLEGKLSGHQKGQHKQCSLHCGGSWSAPLMAGFLLLNKPLLPEPSPHPSQENHRPVARHLAQMASLGLGMFTVGSLSYSDNRAPGEHVVVSLPKIKWS